MRPWPPFRSTALACATGSFACAPGSFSCASESIGLRHGLTIQSVRISLGLLFLSIAASTAALAQTASPVVLDRVVAVVNNQAILASDIDDEIRLSVLDPGRGGLGVLTRTHALDQLIGRALIEQQIRQQDLPAVEPTQSEVDARLADIRKQLPACVRDDCASEAGWNAFLAAHSLSSDRVETYLRYRIEILRFIEQRFRQGISISAQEIAAYYHDTLLPQYPMGEDVPPLDKVSSRIEEILLQQRVNGLFDDWLSNLRKQGEVEVLDPSLEAPASPPAQQPAVPQQGAASPASPIDSPANNDAPPAKPAGPANRAEYGAGIP